LSGWFVVRYCAGQFLGVAAQVGWIGWTVYAWLWLLMSLPLDAAARKLRAQNLVNMACFSYVLLFSHILIGGGVEFLQSY